LTKYIFPAIFLAVCCTGLATAAICSPPQLVHIVTTDITPGMPPDSFNAQPKSFYRIGSGKMRIEEAVDQANGIHGLIVTAEPNIWMVNLFDHTGKHIVDPGPTFYAKAPIFYGVPGLSSNLVDLEFGCEADFISAHAAAPARSEQIGNARFDVYRVAGTGDAVEILERSGTHTPAFTRYYQKGKLLIAVRYDLYGTGLPDDPSLFVPPAGVQYTEAGP
jgi:hypothetical protein